VAARALHVVAVEVLRHGDAVWTTNFDELIEDAASSAKVEVHRLLPGDDPAWACGRGHLVKPHGTLTGDGVLARSEDVLGPLPDAWWFARDGDEQALRRRFGGPLAAGHLSLVLVERPDIAALQWARDEGLAKQVTPELAAQLAGPVARSEIRARYTTDRLLRTRVLDDFGRADAARRGYRSALLRGPRRRDAGAALYSSGLIHGAPWRPPVMARP
jgi:hypothetical protein